MLTAEIPADAFVRADRQRAQQVLINLLSNAIKYNRTNGWVRVTLQEAPAGWLRVAVEDGGRGLGAEQLSRLFQPFERLGRETSSVQGSGLGLVIARQIAEEMGGALALSSVEGIGTTASLDLLAASAQDLKSRPMPSYEEPASLTATPGPAPHTPALRVLYVEDNPVNAIVFEEAMQLCPRAELRIAVDGAAALALVGRWSPDVLVLDAHLPDMTGFDLLEQLRLVPSLQRARAYMCSAAAMPEDLQRARAAGFEDYWVKPIDITAVTSAINALGLPVQQSPGTAPA